MVDNTLADSPIPVGPDAQALLSGECAVVVHDPADPDRVLAAVRVGGTPGTGAPVPPSLARHVGPLLERLPTLVNDGRQLLGEQTYRVVLKPEFVRGVRDGSLRMMESKEVAGGLRLNVVVNRPGSWGDKPGKIVGQGTNVRVGKVARLASAGFQIATFVTAQAHLAEINKRLDGIERTTREILQHLHDVQVGALAGKMGRLREIAARLQSGDVPPDEVPRLDGQLDDIDLTASEVAEAVRLEIARREEALLRESAQISWFDGGAAERQRLDALRTDYTDALDRLAYALGVRLVAAELKAMLPLDSSAPAFRRRAVVEACEEAARQSDRVKQHLARLGDEARSRLRGQSPSNEVASFILNRLERPLAPTRWNQLVRLAQSGERTERRIDASTRRDVVLDVERSGDGTLTARVATPSPQSQASQ